MLTARTVDRLADAPTTPAGHTCPVTEPLLPADGAPPAVGRHAVPRRRRQVPVGAALVVLAAVVAVGLAAVKDGALPAPSGWFGPRVYVEVDGETLEVPRPEPADGRLLPAVPVQTDGAYAFLHTAQDGSPVGYDPCRPVTWVVRSDGAPPGAAALVEEAVAIVSAASGVSFTAVGQTDEAPALDRALIQPERYGDGWAPVLVAWSTALEVPALAGDVAGVGGSAAVPGADGTGQWLAAGRLVLDAEDLGAMLTGPHGVEQARAVVVHELAHVLGLDHVADPTELMNPMTANRTDLGPGDRAGLALVGQVACQ